jgi:hypothetical protein
MLGDGNFLQASGGRLCGGALTKALRDVLTAAKAGKESVASRGTAIGLFARDGQRFVATVIPLTLGARRNGSTSYSAAAAVFVRKAEVDLPMLIEAVANLYKLTPAETRILLAINKEARVPQVASMLVHIGNDRQKSSATRLREDRDQSTGRPRQVGRGLHGTTGSKS